MKKNYKDNIKICTVLLMILIITERMTVLPWWTFLVFVVALGMWIEKKKQKISTFLVGFITGFAVWLLSNLLFHLLYQGSFFIIMDKLSVILILITSGLIGGVLTGLALYVGSVLFKRENETQLL